MVYNTPPISKCKLQIHPSGRPSIIIIIIIIVIVITIP